MNEYTNKQTHTHTHRAVEDETADILGHRRGEFFLKNDECVFFNGTFIMKNQI